MAHYRFLVADSTGRTRPDGIDASDEQEAVRKLAARQLTVIRPLNSGGGGKKQAVSLLDFTDRLNSLLCAGVNLEKSLAILAESAENPEAGAFFRDLRQSLREGKSFSLACADRPRLFPQFYITMIEVGEQSGALDQVMTELLSMLEERKKQRDFIVSNSVYPGIILTISVGVIVFLLTYVIPKFAVIFEGGSKKPSAATQALLDMSTFLRSHWLMIILVGMASVAGLVYCLRSKSLRPKVHQLILNTPIFGKLSRQRNVSIFSRSLALLLRNGVHLLKAVEIASRTLQNEILQKSLQDLPGKLKNGEKLSATLMANSLMPSSVPRMIAVGEETGKLPEMLSSISKRSEQEFSRSVSRMLSLFEPALLVGLGITIGTIVVLMFSSLSSLGR